MSFESWMAIVAIAVLGGICRLVYWMGKVDTDRASFTSGMEETRKELREINAKISGIFVRLKDAPIAGDSPLRLTDRGREILGELEADKWLEETARDLLESVRGKPDYAIQEQCFEYTHDRMQPSQQMEENIRASAYEHTLSRGQVLEILAIALRDRLLALLQDPTPPQAQPEPQEAANG